VHLQHLHLEFGGAVPRSKAFCRLQQFVVSEFFNVEVVEEFFNIEVVNEMFVFAAIRQPGQTCP